MKTPYTFHIMYGDDGVQLQQQQSCMATVGPSGLIERRDSSTLVSAGEGGGGEVVYPQKGRDGPGREILAYAQKIIGENRASAAALQGVLAKTLPGAVNLSRII